MSIPEKWLTMEDSKNHVKNLVFWLPHFYTCCGYRVKDALLERCGAGYAGLAA